MVSKRGQFFLLAAVIISAVVISLGVGTNRVTVNEEPESFYDFTYEAKREIGAVLDYEVYTSDDVDLEGFVNSLAKDIEEKNPGSEFVSIYGDEDGMTLTNHGSEEVIVRDHGPVRGARRSSSGHAGDGGAGTNPRDTFFDYDGAVLQLDDLSEGHDVSVDMGGTVVDFPVPSHKQVMVFIKKEDRGDEYVARG